MGAASQPLLVLTILRPSPAVGDGGTCAHAGVWSRRASGSGWRPESFPACLIFGGKRGGGGDGWDLLLSCTFFGRD